MGFAALAFRPKCRGQGEEEPQGCHNKCFKRGYFKELHVTFFAIV
jgi:hypothetical protein